MTRRDAGTSSSNFPSPENATVLRSWSFVALGLLDVACAAWSFSAPIKGSLSIVGFGLSADVVRSFRIAAGCVGTIFGALVLRIGMLPVSSADPELLASERDAQEGGAKAPQRIVVAATSQAT